MHSVPNVWEHVMSYPLFTNLFGICQTVFLKMETSNDDTSYLVMNEVAFRSHTDEGDFFDRALLRWLNRGWEIRWIPVLFWLSLPIMLGFDLAFYKEFGLWSTQGMILAMCNLLTAVMCLFGFILFLAIQEIKGRWTGMVMNYEGQCATLRIDPQLPLLKQAEQARATLLQAADVFVAAEANDPEVKKKPTKDLYAALSGLSTTAGYILGGDFHKGGDAHGNALRIARLDRAQAIAIGTTVEQYRKALESASRPSGSEE